MVGFINKYEKDQTTKRGLIYVYLHETSKNITPNLEKAKDGHEHSRCGYFTIGDLPFSKKNDQLEEIIKKVLKK